MQDGDACIGRSPPWVHGPARASVTSLPGAQAPMWQRTASDNLDRQLAAGSNPETLRAAVIRAAAAAAVAALSLAAALPA